MKKSPLKYLAKRWPVDSNSIRQVAAQDAGESKNKIAEIGKK
jgi:hypothetical protein